MKEQIHRMAWLSGLVYEPWDVVRMNLANHGDAWELVRTFECHGSEAMLVRRTWVGDNDYYLVFRGTEFSDLKFKDIFHNFGRAVPWVGLGEVHSGYYEHFEEVAWDAREFADEVPDDARLWVTGHSLGGALAGLYASWVGYHNPEFPGDAHNICGLVTFGAPLAMDAEAGSTVVTFFNYRVTAPCDFAPHWPLSFRCGKHLGEHISLKPQSWWPGPVSRHSIDGYINSTSDMKGITL